MNRDVLIPVLVSLMMISLLSFVALTLSSVWLFVPGVTVALVVHFNTFYKKTPDPQNILPLYLFALGIQFIHFTEEYLTDFQIALPQLLGREEYPLDYWIVFNMVAYFFFILGGIIIFKKMKNLMVLPLFFVVVGVVLNSVGHIAISLYVGGYFPGLYSALLYVLIGPYLVRNIIK